MWAAIHIVWLGLALGFAAICRLIPLPMNLYRRSPCLSFHSHPITLELGVPGHREQRPGYIKNHHPPSLSSRFGLPANQRRFLSAFVPWCMGVMEGAQLSSSLSLASVALADDHEEVRDPHERCACDILAVFVSGVIYALVASWP